MLGEDAPGEVKDGSEVSGGLRVDMVCAGSAEEPRPPRLVFSNFDFDFICSICLAFNLVDFVCFMLAM